MPTVVETLEIQFRASTGNVNQAVKKTKKALQGLEDADIEVKANTKDADKKLGDVRKKTQQASEDATVEIGADNKEALDKIGSVQDALDGLDAEVKVKVNTDDAQKAVGKLDSSMSGLMTTLKASGLLIGAKQGFDFTMNLVNVASDAEQGFSRLQGTLGAGALGTLQDYVSGLSSDYGFNETAIYDMASQFITLFKAYNYEEQEATDYAMRLIEQAIDYASFFNMTPAEVGAYFMSMLKGSYEVGDSIGMPLNATRLDAFAADRGIQGADELATRAAAFVDYAETNADMVGLAGDWERTADQFANVTTVLDEQWTTLKENAGAKLLPAATTVATGLSNMLGAMNAFLAEDTPDMDTIFGKMRLSEEQIQGIVQDITGPVAEINSALNASSGLLDKAVNKFSGEYTELMELLNLTYASGQPIDESTNDQIGMAVNALADSAQETVSQSQATLTSMLLTLSGDQSQWTTATETALANIDAYYKGVSERITEKTGELRQLIWDSAVDDDIIDAFEMGSITEKARELMQEVYESSMIQYGAAAQEYIDRNMRSGQIDAKSVMELYRGVMEATAGEKAEMEENYHSVRRGIYEVAESNRLEYEKDPAAYIREHGAAPATAQEMLADLDRSHELNMAQLDADVADRFSRSIFSSMLDGMQGMALSEDMDFYALMTEVIDPMEEYAEYAELLRSIQGRGGLLSAESSSFLDLYDGLMELGEIALGTPEHEMVSADYSVELFRDLISQISTDFYSGEYQQNALDGAEIEAPGVESAIQESNGLLRQLVGKDWSITMNGYRLGQLTQSGGDQFHKVLGR